MAKEKSNGMGIASLILGILGIVLFFSGLGIILGGLGTVFAVVQKKRHDNSVATAGLVTSVVGLVLSLLVFLLLIASYPLLMSL